jgi:anion-transporting  ArsA/GET3 family ATPase
VSPTKPRLTVCVGGGGVGKTTTSAALALHLARSGKRTLVITVDPARRLADALGVELGQETRPVTVAEGTEGRLFAKMPDPRIGMGDLLLGLFDDPAQRQRVMSNPAYRELSNSLAGVHELLTVGLVQSEMDSGRFDEVVLDTAPSRNALSFLGYPGRFLGLLEARALTWLSSLAASNAPGDSVPPPSGPASRAGGIFAWGRAKVEGLFGRIVGLEALRNLSALFGEMASVRARWAQSVRRSQEIFDDPGNRFLVVGAPAGGSLADVRFLVEALAKRSLTPTAIVLNRAETGPSEEETAVARLLETRPDLTERLGARQGDLLRTTLDSLGADHRARAAAADEAVRFLARYAPRGTPVLRLPFVGPGSPRDVVLKLADAWRDVLAAQEKPLL